MGIVNVGHQPAVPEHTEPGRWLCLLRSAILDAVEKLVGVVLHERQTLGGSNATDFETLLGTGSVPKVSARKSLGPKQT